MMAVENPVEQQVEAISTPPTGSGTPQDFTPRGTVAEDRETPRSSLARLKRVDRLSTFIAVLFLVGAGWIVWQSRSIRPGTLSKDGLEKDAVVTAGLDQMQMEAVTGPARQRRKDILLRDSLDAVRRREMLLPGLSLNPFVFYAEREKIKQAALAAQAQQTEAQVPKPPVAPPVADLRLESVLIGSGEKPSAIISGVLVQEGQTVNQWKVVRIMPKQVVLQWQDQTHVLKML